MIIIVIITLVLLICLYMLLSRKTFLSFETFGDLYGYDNYDDYDGYTNYPFWNVQLGSRRNMSYDLRSDVPIKYTYTGPWLQSSRHPIQNRPLLI